MNDALDVNRSADQEKPSLMKCSRGRLAAVVVLLLGCVANAADEGKATKVDISGPQKSLPKQDSPKVEVRRADVFDKFSFKRTFSRIRDIFEPSGPQETLCPSRLNHLRRLGEEDKQSEAILERALTLREKSLGEKHPQVAESLNNLALLHGARGDYDGSRALYERLLKLRKEAFGEKHQEVANVLSNLASLDSAQGRYAEAEGLYKQALDIQQEKLGKDHFDIAGTHSGLALLYKEQGRYKEANDAYERAIEILKVLLGEQHPNVASLRHSLAEVYRLQGMYSDAELLHKKALAVREASLGKSHLDVASSLHYLADLFTNQGLYKRAEPLYERALSIREANLGECHPDVASSLHSLAGLYKNLGWYPRARPLYERALAIQEAALGENHPKVADLIYDLAFVHHAQKNYAQAESLYERARQRQAVLGDKRPQYADALHALASLAAEQGKYDKAQTLFESALAIRVLTFGENHPKLIESYHQLARLFLARQQLAEALPFLEKVVMLSEGRLRREILGRTEYQVMHLMDMLSADEELLYSLASAHPEDAGVRELALTVALLRKGRSIDEIANTSSIIYNHLGPADVATFNVLRNLRTEYAKLALSRPGDLTLAAYQQRLTDLESQGDALESNLAKNSAPLRALQDTPQPEEFLARVTIALAQKGEDGVLVEFVAYNNRSPIANPGGSTPDDAKSQQNYLALLLFPDGETRAVNLGSSLPIDSATKAMHTAFSKGLTYLEEAQTLYKLVFQPIANSLGMARRLFVAPDSELALIPFVALHDGSRFLVDTLDITYLTSGRELLPRSYELMPSQTVAVMADPDFGERTSKGSADRSRSAATTRTGLEKQLWDSLPATRREAEAIKNLYPQAHLYLGADANKETLLSMNSPGVLHIATHGYLLDAPPDPSTTEITRAVQGIEVLATNEPQPSPADPLLRSGLVLARPKGSEKTVSDSLVTALELANLNLWGTQLVVLSACNTGQGTSKPGQGVLGMRRSLVAAGAETLVTSLWKVDDETTRELMEAYYYNLIVGQGRATALREAMRTLRTKYPHPHFWAPFIAIGQDGPLQGLKPQLVAQPDDPSTTSGTDLKPQLIAQPMP